MSVMQSAAMKRVLAIFGDTALVFAAVACSMGAVISAFSFTVDMAALVLFWAAAALMVALLASFWRGKGLLVLLAPVLALVLLRRPEIAEGAKWALFVVTDEFSKWLFVETLFPDAVGAAYELTLFFAAAGAALSLLLSVAVCLRRSTLLTVLFTAPLVFLTFVIIFTQPDLMYIMGLVAVYLTMLFSNALFPDDFRKRALAVFPALVMAAVLMGSASILTPAEGYSRDSLIRAVDHQIRNFASRTGIARIRTGIGWPVAYDGSWRFQTYNIDISSAGVREISDTSLLEVSASESGLYYLRGFAMLHFDGEKWTVNEGDVLLRGEQFANMVPAYVAILYSELFADDSATRASMAIARTGDSTTNVYYTPYYSFPFDYSSRPTGPYLVDFYYVEESLLELFWLLPGAYQAEIDLTDYSKLVNSEDTYLNIDPDTAEELRRIAAELGIDQAADRAEVVSQVAEFFTSFGAYTLSPLIVPKGEDFVLYFLNVSRQGYCIHYATAATLMLRALGVPARFTSGFAVPIYSDEIGLPVVVTDYNAHSWVEVFYEQVGWLPLEVTPSGGGPGGYGRGNGGFGAAPGPGGIAPGPGPDIGYDPFGQGAEWDTEPPVDVTGSFWRGPGWMIAAGSLAACLAALITRRIVVLSGRKRRFNMADANLSVIFAWRYLLRLARLKTWQTPWHEIEDLAEKARFSQHRLTEGERSKVVDYVHEFAANIYHDRTPAGRLWVKFVRGL